MYITVLKAESVVYDINVLKAYYVAFVVSWISSTSVVVFTTKLRNLRLILSQDTNATQSPKAKKVEECVARAFRFSSWVLCVRRLSTYVCAMYRAQRPVVFAPLTKILADKRFENMCLCLVCRFTSSCGNLVATYSSTGTILEYAKDKQSIR